MAGKPVSVAHLMYGLDLGGLEQLVVQLASYSQKRGIRTAIVALGPDGPVRKLAQENGVELELLPDAGLTPSALLGIRRALDRIDATVLHAHDLGPWLNAVAARMLRPTTRVLATFHEQRTPEGRKRQAAGIAARFTEALVACGDQVRDEIRRWAPAGTNIPIIPNGVPLTTPAPGARKAARDELGIPEGAIAIGYLGGFREVKGPDKLVEAFVDKFGKRPEVQLVLIGGGEMEGRLRTLAQGHDNVRFAGVKLNGARLLPGLDVYAQTSLSEGRSLSMLEAMAAGLPTVAHALGPVQEIHAHGKSALLVPLGDRAGLGAALGQLVDDPALRERLGSEARTLSQKHGIEPMIDAYEALYRRP